MQKHSLGSLGLKQGVINICRLRNESLRIGTGKQDFLDNKDNQGYNKTAEAVIYQLLLKKIEVKIKLFKNEP